MGVIIRIPVESVTLLGTEKIGTTVSLQSKQLSSSHESAVDIPVATELHIQPKDIYKYITVELGSSVQTGDCIAQKKGLLKKTRVLAPIAAEVRKIDHNEGIVTLIEKTAMSHSFTIAGQWKGIEGGNAIIELHEGITVPISYVLPQSISGDIHYCEQESAIDDSITGGIVVTPLTSSVAISRICAFDPIAVVTSRVVYYSQQIPQLTIKNEHDMDTILKKRYNVFLYKAGDTQAYFYTQTKNE